MGRIDEVSNAIWKDVYIRNILHYVQLFLEEGFSLERLVDTRFLNYDYLDRLSFNELCRMKRDFVSAYAFFKHSRLMEDPKLQGKCK